MVNLKSLKIYVFALLIAFAQIQCTELDEEDEITEIITEVTDDGDNEEEIEEEEIEEEEEEESEEETEGEEENEEETEDEENQQTDAEGLLILVNASRAEEGLPALILNNALNIAAQAHSTDMLTNDYFSHTGLNGSRFWERTEDAGYTGSARGENIALGQRTIEAVHNSWMSSDGHRANILSENITEMGLGRAENYWTQIFGYSNN